jgi:hypothetical protein
LLLLGLSLPASTTLKPSRGNVPCAACGNTLHPAQKIEVVEFTPDAQNAIVTGWPLTRTKN